MAQDGGLYTDVIDKPNGTRKGASGFNFDKVLIWDTPEHMAQFKALVANPPLHSVVVHVDPVMAKLILKASNDRNRPISGGSVQNLVDAHESGDFSKTGDTIKFSKKGRLLDGQYRLTSGISANKGFETHMVFGLDEDVFDILDRQRTRTPGDILAICGVKDAIMVAGAVRWVLHMEAGMRGRTNRGMSPRRIRELATGPMKDLAHYTRQAEQIREAYKVPPTMCAALLFLIGQRSKATVDSFVQDWLHGNRNYARNKAFDALSQRIQTVRSQNNGALNRTVLAAMLVLAFNYWNANVAATPKSITWVKQWQFPQLAFDKEAFVRGLERRKASDESLPALQERLLKAVAGERDKSGNAQVSYADLAKKANVEKRHVGYVLGALRDANVLHMAKAPDKKTNAPAVWRLKAEGEKRLQRPDTSRAPRIAARGSVSALKLLA